MAKGKKGFQWGNKDAEKWPEKKCITIFESLFIWINEKNNVLSMEEVRIRAMTEYNVPYSSFDYLIKKYSVLGNIKKAMNDVLIARINKRALLGDFNPTASIWRMKQLGERDPDKKEASDALRDLKIKITQD